MVSLREMEAYLKTRKEQFSGLKQFSSYARTFGTTEDLRDIGHDVSEEVMREVDQMAGGESYSRVLGFRPPQRAT